MADDNQIEIKVTATTDGMQSGLASASKQVESFGDQINNLAEKAQAVNPDAFKELAEGLNAGKVDLDEFRDGLIAITTAQSAAANEAVNLATKSAISSSALRELTVVSRELATGNLTRLPGSLSILAQRLGGIPPMAILAVGAVAAFGYAIYEVIERSQEFEADLDKIQNAFTAVGAGGQFDRSQITQYIDELRNIPGVTEEMATSAVNSFARVQNGTKVLGEATRDLRPFANLIGVEVPQAAKVLAEALNDPAKGLQDLQKYGVELSASQQEDIRQMMAMNDVAGAQRVLMDGLATAMAHVVDTSTPLQRYFSGISASLSGVSIEAEHAQKALLAAADAATKVGDTDSARRFRDQASAYDSRTRNLPNTSTSAATSTAEQSAQADAERQNRLDNERITALDKMNSALNEQEQHQANIAKIQEGIDAAQRQGNDHGVRQGYSALETENKRYYGAGPREDHSDDKNAMAEAKGDAAAADARIKTEQAVVNEKQRLGEISTQEAVRQLEELAAQEHAINLRRIADMRAVSERTGDKAGVTNANAQAAQEDERYSQQKIELDLRAREAAEAVQKDQIEGDAKLAEAKIANAEKAAKEQAELGQITAQQELATLTDLTNQESAVQQKKFSDLATLYGNDLAKFTQYQNEKALAELKAEQQISALNTEAARKKEQEDQQEQASFAQTAQRMVAPWQSALTNMNSRTNVWQQATIQAQRGIETNLVSGVSRMVANWLLGENEKSAATAIAAKFRQLTQTEGTSEAVQQNIESTAKNQSTDAVGVFSNVFNYLSPELGPFAAAPAAAASAAVLALSLPSAAGGMVVPNDNAGHGPRERNGFTRALHVRSDQDD